MAVTEQIPSITSTANGLTDAFPYGFLIFDKADLLVQVDGVTKTEGVHYTVSGVGNPTGGSVTFTAGNRPPANAKVLRERVMAAKRDTDFQEAGDYFAAEVNKDYDRAIMLVQQINAAISRAMRVRSDLLGVVDTELPTPAALAPLVWNAAANKLENGSTTLTGDMLLRGELAQGVAGKGSALVKHYDPVAPAYLKTQSDMNAGIPVNIRRFTSDAAIYSDDIFTGATTYDATTALQAAIAAFSENRTRRGGRLELGRGRFIVAQTLRTTPFATDNTINLEIAGEGYMATWLDFSGMVRDATNLDAIVIDNDQQVRLSGFYLKGGGNGATKARDGLVLGRKGGGDGGNVNNAASLATASRIRVQGFARDGVHHYNTYTSRLEQVYSLFNGRDGFHGEGFHTSLTHDSCYARGNFQDPVTYAADRGAGFRFNGMVYSSFINCASDLNDYGYILSNARGTVYLGCGSEGNNRDGWYVFADQGTVDTTNPLMVQECYDVSGVSLLNCSGYGNSAGGAGYAGLLRAVANGVHTGAGTLGDSSAHRVDVVVANCDASVGPNAAKAIITSQGTGGVVQVVEEGFNRLPGGRTIGSGTTHINRSVAGRVCMVQTLAQTCATGVASTITLNTTPTKNDMGATVSASGITIPAGVNRVRVTANVGWTANGTGYREAKVLKNAAGAPGLPQDNRTPTAATFTLHNLTGADIDVVAGDVVSLQVTQTSGGNLDTIGASNASWLCVEAIC